MNEELINKIRAMLQEGKRKVDICKELGISTTTVNIYSSDESYQKYKERVNSEKCKKYRRDYTREYMKRRYKNDEEFRKRIKEHQKKYREKQREVENNEDS